MLAVVRTIRAARLIQMIYKPIKVSFGEADLELLTRQAQEAGISRSEWIRERALRSDEDRTSQPFITPAGYNRLVSRAARKTMGGVSRVEVAALVGFVISEIAAEAKA